MIVSFDGETHKVLRTSEEKLNKKAAAFFKKHPNGIRCDTLIMTVTVVHRIELFYPDKDGKDVIYSCGYYNII